MTGQPRYASVRLVVAMIAALSPLMTLFIRVAAPENA
jgi:hypothetical protein